MKKSPVVKWLALHLPVANGSGVASSEPSIAIAAVKTAGIGLRSPHIGELLADDSESVPWLELLADNWLSNGGATMATLARLAERFPLAVHGVGLSIGSLTPLNTSYLQRVAGLLKRAGAISYSEHLSFSQTGAGFVPDLLPLPYSDGR